MTSKVAFIILTCISYIYGCMYTYTQEAHSEAEREQSHAEIKPHLNLILTLDFPNTVPIKSPFN